MFKDYLRAWLGHKDDPEDPLPRRTLVALGAEIRRDLLDAFELAGPLLRENAALFEASSSFADFLFRLLEVPRPVVPSRGGPRPGVGPETTMRPPPPPPRPSARETTADAHSVSSDMIIDDPPGFKDVRLDAIVQNQKDIMTHLNNVLEGVVATYTQNESKFIEQRENVEKKFTEQNETLGKNLLELGTIVNQFNQHFEILKDMSDRYQKFHSRIDSMNDTLPLDDVDESTCILDSSPAAAFSVVVPQPNEQKIGKLTNQLQVYQRNINDLQCENKSSNETVERLKQELNQCEREHRTLSTTYQGALETWQSEKDTFVRENERLRSQYNAADNNQKETHRQFMEQSEKLRLCMEQLELLRQSNLKVEKMDVAVQDDVQTAMNEKWKVAYNDLEQNYAILRTENDGLITDKNELQKQLIELSNEMTKLNDHNRNLHELHESDINVLDDHKRTIDQLNSKINLLQIAANTENVKEMQNNFEGQLEIERNAWKATELVLQQKIDDIKTEAEKCIAISNEKHQELEKVLDEKQSELSSKIIELERQKVIDEQSVTIANHKYGWVLNYLKYVMQNLYNHMSTLLNPPKEKMTVFDENLIDQPFVLPEFIKNWKKVDQNYHYRAEAIHQIVQDLFPKHVFISEMSKKEDVDEDILKLKKTINAFFDVLEEKKMKHRNFHESIKNLDHVQEFVLHLDTQMTTMEEKLKNIVEKRDIKQTLQKLEVFEPVEKEDSKRGRSPIRSVNREDEEEEEEEKDTTECKPRSLKRRTHQDEEEDGKRSSRPSKRHLRHPEKFWFDGIYRSILIVYDEHEEMKKLINLMVSNDLAGLETYRNRPSRISKTVNPIIGLYLERYRKMETMKTRMVKFKAIIQNLKRPSKTVTTEPDEWTTAAEVTMNMLKSTVEANLPPDDSTTTAMEVLDQLTTDVVESDPYMWDEEWDGKLEVDFADICKDQEDWLALSQTLKLEIETIRPFIENVSYDEKTKSLNLSEPVLKHLEQWSALSTKLSAEIKEIKPYFQNVIYDSETKNLSLSKPILSHREDVETPDSDGQKRKHPSSSVVIRVVQQQQGTSSSSRPRSRSENIDLKDYIKILDLKDEEIKQLKKANEVLREHSTLPDLTERMEYETTGGGGNDKTTTEVSWFLTEEIHRKLLQTLYLLNLMYLKLFVTYHNNVVAPEYTCEVALHVSNLYDKIKTLKRRDSVLEILFDFFVTFAEAVTNVPVIPLMKKPWPTFDTKDPEEWVKYIVSQVKDFYETRQ